MSEDGLPKKILLIRIFFGERNDSAKRLLRQMTPMRKTRFQTSIWAVAPQPSSRFFTGKHGYCILIGRKVFSAQGAGPAVVNGIK